MGLILRLENIVNEVFICVWYMVDIIRIIVNIVVEIK